MKKLVLPPNSLIQKERLMLVILQIFLHTSCPFFSFHLMNFIESNYLLLPCSSALRFDSLMVWTCCQINLSRMVTLKTWVNIRFWNLFIWLKLSVKSQTSWLVLWFNVYSSVCCRFFRRKILSCVLKAITLWLDGVTLKSNVLFSIFVDRTLTPFLIFSSFETEIDSKLHIKVHL